MGPDFEDLPYMDMTPYERSAWATLSALVEDEDGDGEVDAESSVLRRARERAAGALEASGERARDAWAQVPGNERVEEQIARAIDGAFRAYLDVITRTIPPDEIRDEVAKAARRPLVELQDIQTIDLKHVHKAMPSLGKRRAAVAGLHGAAAGFVAGGATAAGAASGGMGALPAAGVFAVTMTADAAGVVSSSLQASGLIGAYHGFVPVDGAGQYEVLKLQAAVAGAGAAKMAVLKEVRELALMLAARRTVAELSKSALYQMLRRAFGYLTLSTAKRSIAKGVPVAGVLLGGGWNYGVLRRGIAGAEEFYDLRFLYEKYGDDQLPDPDRGEPEDVVPELDDGDVGHVLDRLDKIESERENPFDRDP